jgi:hypothetical protein
MLATGLGRWAGKVIAGRATYVCLTAALSARSSSAEDPAWRGT